MIEIKYPTSESQIKAMDWYLEKGLVMINPYGTNLVRVGHNEYMTTTKSGKRQTFIGLHKVVLRKDGKIQKWSV
jgi:ABC-type branched-subunit amino acid transport system substrate-binding protein